jgi:fused signal recognition particle receptor
MLGLFKKTDPERPWLARLKDGLANTRSRLSGLFGGGKIDEALFEELETALLASDAGLEATQFLVASLRECSRSRRLQTVAELKSELLAILTELLAPLEATLDVLTHKPFVILLAGVNGAGKTTSIGKLAKFFQSRGLSVLLAAGDTFRAAAREQLAVWGERNGVAVIAQSAGDPGAVVYDAIQAARSRGLDVVLADTAGRLPTQRHLMEEARKIKRVIAKADPSAPHEIWLVLDANTGQNALSQVKAFDAALGLTGLVLTKLDGTAKGGVVCAIALARSSGALARRVGASGTSKSSEQRPLPLRFIGVGEGIGDLQPFVAREFAAALLD